MPKLFTADLSPYSPDSIQASLTASVSPGLSGCSEYRTLSTAVMKRLRPTLRV